MHQEQHVPQRNQYDFLEQRVAQRVDGLLDQH